MTSLDSIESSIDQLESNMREVFAEFESTHKRMGALTTEYFSLKNALKTNKTNKKGEKERKKELKSRLSGIYTSLVPRTGRHVIKSTTYLSHSSQFIYHADVGKSQRPSISCLRKIKTKNRISQVSRAHRLSLDRSHSSSTLHPSS